MVPDDDLFPATLPMNAAVDSLMAVALEKAEDGRTTLRERRAIRKLERNGLLQRLSTRRAAERYAAEGGEEGTGLKFFEWLVANWETILKMIMQIVGLFGGGAVAATEGVVAPANALFDIDAVGESVARKLLELVEVAERHGLAAKAAIEAYIAKAWPENQPTPPAELQRAFAVAIAA
jgi:hypothetical protein